MTIIATAILLLIIMIIIIVKIIIMMYTSIKIITVNIMICFRILFFII